MWTTLRGSLKNRLSLRRVLSVMLLLPWAAVGANLSWRKGKYGQCIDWTGTTITVRPHLVFKAVWLEISTSTKPQNFWPSRKDSHSETDSWTSKNFYMSPESSAGPAVSSRGSPLSTRLSGPPSGCIVSPRTPHLLFASRITTALRWDQGIAVGLTHARRCSSNRCLVVHSRQNPSDKPHNTHRRLSLEHDRHPPP